MSDELRDALNAAAQQAYADGKIMLGYALEEIAQERRKVVPYTPEQDRAMFLLSPVNDEA